MVIEASSLISFQPTFQNRGFSGTIAPLGKNGELIVPPYENIPPMERRRMSAVLKSSIACALDCLEQAVVVQPDAIIVGTSMGCCQHTKSFLDKIYESDGGLLSPTAFIHSTHNSIAGQISLHLKNYNYNMTHSHGTLSFEQALLDALMGLGEGFNNVLVGGADETESALYNMNARLGRNDIAHGAGFFLLTSQQNSGGKTEVVEAAAYSLIDGITGLVKEFIERNGRSLREIDRVLYSSSSGRTLEDLSLLIDRGRLTDFQAYSGTWFTNSAFAMTYAVDILSTKEHPVYGPCSNILICNNLVPENLGLILLTRR